MDTACKHRIHMWRIQDTSVLVVAVDNTVPKEDYFPHIEEALELIEQGTNKTFITLVTYFSEY